MSHQWIEKISKQAPILLFALSVAGVFHLTIYNKELREAKPQLNPPEGLEHMTLGYREPLADSLWLQLLQNSDYCENPEIKKAANKGGNLEEILSVPLSPSRCNKGWAYKMVDTITNISPKFEMAYKLGGLMLSIGVDDREGARLIFEKALRLFPENWEMSFQAAYHYLYEMQDKKRAAELMTQASNSPRAPSYLPSLAARLYAMDGQAALGIATLKAYLERNPEGRGADRARQRLQQLEEGLKKPHSF